MNIDNYSILHHTEICVRDEVEILKLFVEGFQFRLTHFRFNQFYNQWVLNSGYINYIITKNLRKLSPEGKEPNTDSAIKNGDRNSRDSDKEENMKNSENILENLRTEYFSRDRCKTVAAFHDKSLSAAITSEYPPLFCCKLENCHSKDAVFNIALEVKNVEDITHRIEKRLVLLPPTVLESSEGKIRIAVIKSICSNVIHTIIDKSDYDKTSFLPGFQPISDLFTQTNKFKKESICAFPEKKLITQLLDSFRKNSEVKTKNTRHKNDLRCQLASYIDHVTFVCECDESKNILSWYEEIFKMKRFFTNREETIPNGLVLEGSIGLRLKAMTYWSCAETGIEFSDENVNCSKFLRIVVAEPLRQVESSHVRKFLSENEGGGIQHIGMACENITKVVHQMRQNGIKFRMPPSLYYEECGDLKEMVKYGLANDVQELIHSGILIDSETQHSEKRYLMQIFTEPIFKEDTFFMEIIQRFGATGFGSGNILALARSIVRSQNERNKSK